MEIAIRHKTYWRGPCGCRAAGLRVRKSVPRSAAQKKPRSRSAIAAPRYRSVSVTLCFDSRESPQQAAELRIDFTRRQIATDDLALLVDEQHRRQSEDPQGVGQRAVEPARLIQLRPADGVLLQVGIEGRRGPCRR